VTAFKDHFSKHAEAYSRYRAHYPEALYVSGDTLARIG
jgi:hypothetical protein